MMDLLWDLALGLLGVNVMMLAICLFYIALYG